MKFVLTCEHAGNIIPDEYLELFKNAGNALNSHRGYDPGALDLFNFLKDLPDVSFFHPYSRLLVEVNRSYGHPQVFSEFTAPLTPEEKEVLIGKFYTPYRKAVELAIVKLLEEDSIVLHLSVHSFTPVLNDVTRNNDVGLLYDPTRVEEKNFSKLFKEYINLDAPSLKIRFNYPYLGKADGLTTYFRKRFPFNYLGIELEVNQKFSRDNIMEASLKEAVYRSLDSSLNIQGDNLK